MNSYIFYYTFALLGVVAYVRIKKRHSLNLISSKWLEPTKRILIISYYMIGAYGIYLASDLKDDSFINWSILISVVIILVCYLKMIWSLESLGKH